MNNIKGCRYGMMIYNKLDIWQGRSFEIYGEFSESECELFKKCIKPKDVVLDIGANIGSHTLCFSKLVGPEGSVISFEPERTAFYTLCGNVSINSLRNVFCFQHAVGENNGKIEVPELDLSTQNWGGIELLKKHSNTYAVQMIAIDKITIPKINFIKIDVEGMEKNVLLGAKETIEKHRPYLYVENDRLENITDLNRLIDTWGYDIYQHEAPLFNLNNFNNIKENVFTNQHGGQIISGNIFCVPKEKNIDFKTNEITGMSAEKLIIKHPDVDLDDPNIPKLYT